MTDRGKNMAALLNDSEKKLSFLLANSPHFMLKGGSSTYGKAAKELIANGVTFATDNNAGGKWIPVTERLPGTEKVLITDGEIVMRGYRRPDGVWKYGVGLDEVWEKLSLRPVTHWMPLPEPPMRKGENG